MPLSATLRDSFEHLPLSRRMVLLLVSVLAVGLALAGTLMIAVLDRHLVGQVDRQLEASAQQLAEQISAQILHEQQVLVPSEYYVRVDPPLGEGIEFLTSATEDRAGHPRLNLSPTTRQLVMLSGGSDPITVSSSMPGAKWRALSLPFTSWSSGRVAGVVTVALPLVGVTETLANTATWFLMAATALIGVAWLIGHYLVRKSLQPLSNIEIVAGAIAAGDLSKRIPNAPLTTEVGSLSASLNTMLVQIERSFAANEKSEQKMRRFVADASHELRTPLAAIRGYGELYRMGGITQDGVADAMDRIEAESRRMGILVEDLLTLARLDDNRALRLEKVDLTQLVSQAKSDLHAIDPSRTIRTMGTHGQRIPASLEVLADRDQLMQVFLNLAGNIVRYTPAGSPVQILLGKAGSRAVIEFRDHGPGVAEEDRGRVFERFYRTGKSRSRELGGSGLGLSIVDSIVQAHGGEVSLWETDPHGLTVRVMLPLSVSGK